MGGPIYLHSRVLFIATWVVLYAVATLEGDVEVVAVEEDTRSDLIESEDVSVETPKTNSDLKDGWTKPKRSD